MKVSVDGRSRTASGLPGTIGALLSRLKAEVADRDRVVIGLTLDGLELDAAEQQRLASRAVEDFSELALETADARELCLSTLEEAGNHIQPVVDESARVAELIDAGKEQEALERLLPCLEVWSTVIAAVEKCAVLMEIDLDSLTSENGDLDDVTERLTVFLGELKKSIDSHDLVSVRDSMKYEMPELAAIVRGLVDSLSSAISAH